MMTNAFTLRPSYGGRMPADIAAIDDREERARKIKKIYGK